MRFVRITALLMTVIFISSGCQASGIMGTEDQNAYEKIRNIIVNMQTYMSHAIVEYRSNKGANIYETIQKARATGEYRVEVVGPENVAGNITIFDGSTIYQFNTRISGKIAVATKESQERSEIFFTSFIRNYLESNETSVSAAMIENDPATVLEAQIPGNHPYLATQKVWFDNNTHTPIKMIIYDPQGSERIIVTYSGFEYNIAIEDSEFKA